jgi:beta-N-acetylhexosaminidase
VAVAALVDSTAARRPTVLLSFGSPYVIRQAPGAWAYLLGWAARPESERAVAEALTGLAPITGTLPASIPPLFPAGTGVHKGGP